MKFCQILIAAFTLFSFLLSLRSDFYGREEKEPGGFSGAVCSFIALALALLTYWGAGAFSTLVH